ncbi:MAG TPA: hypothetical protein DEA58_00605, partial [Pseudothermotoga sp.]
MRRAILLAVLFCTNFLLAREISLREFELWDRDGLVNSIWCSVTVKDGLSFVPDLSLNNFEITETAYDKYGDLIEERPVSFDNIYYQFDGEGFWEKSVNSDKLDIVFLIDYTGSMYEHMAAIKEQLLMFLNRLSTTKTDFRIIVAKYSVEDEPEWPSGTEADRFFGPAMINEIKHEIQELGTAGEGWNFTWAYDAFLWTLDLDWREDARKIVVIITDVFTDSVYG